ncbi:MAG: hypothetical protein JWP27_1929 [Flaviaesturariibacter sp.]|nr:hypothetical protein [Flaviaesturariibacter sp.]
MKRLSQYLLGIFLLFGFFACQKEISRESGAPGAGSLQDLLGDCLPKVIGGTYVAGSNVVDSNYIDVGVHVTKKGSYTIASDVQNGYSFRGTGAFADTGLVMVRLKASGKPVAAGTNDFTITYDSSFCSVAVTVLPAGSTGGASGSCGATVSGTYTRGIALNSTNTVSIQHTYAAAGTFTVATDTVNGISFKKVVTVSAPGAQTIVMSGLGTPIAAQGTHLKVKFGTGNAADTCSFDVTVVVPAPSTAANSYFPLTQGSWWTYDDAAGDSTIVTVNGTATLSTKLYTRFITTDDSGTGLDTSYYRKDAATNNFYQYVDLNDLSGGGQITFAAGTPSEMLFLKETLTTGATWNNDYTGTASGIPLVIRIKFTCVNAAATATYGGVTFNNVYKVTAMVQINAAGTGFQDQGDQLTFYYAKGVGLINFNDGIDDYPILHWLVL